MRRSCYCAVFFFSFTVMALGKLVPLTVKEVSLMLRSGYSVAAVESDLAARHFVGLIDAAAEKQLREVGASPALIASLKSERFALPPQEVRGRAEGDGNDRAAAS